MKPSELRDELLAQHEGLRDQLDAARVAAEQWQRGHAPQSHIRDELADLASALRRHHLREERALKELIRSIDSGDESQGMTDEEHAGKHREMLDALARVSEAQDPGEGGRQLERFCARVLDHMTREEKAWLNATVLRDDDGASKDAQRG
jgi:hypothetical protein